MSQCVKDPTFLRGSWLQVAALIILTFIHGDIDGACPCLPITAERAFVTCDFLAEGVDSEQLKVQEARFQGLVQFCSSVSGLPDAVLEGLWRIGQPGQPVGPGVSSRQAILRGCLIKCPESVFPISFNQHTIDGADAFSLLKTIQEGDELRFARINPGNCEVIETITACAAGEVIGCGPLLEVPVLEAPGLASLYASVGEYVALLNFGPRQPEPQICPNCPRPAFFDRLCWPSLVCTGLMPGFIPPECTGLTGAGEQILVNAGNLGAVTIIAVPKVTRNGFSVSDALCSLRVDDRLRLYAPGISSQTTLDIPPGGVVWATSLEDPFGPITLVGDFANAVVIDNDDNVVLAGFHTLPNGQEQFAALQLVRDGMSVQLGWATALSGPFGVQTVDEEANGAVLGADGTIILAGFSNDGSTSKFAALQLIPSGATVQLGWATALSGPFGAPSSGDRANAIVRADDDSFILVGQHEAESGVRQFAALQLLPSGPGNVVLGWATTVVGPFGSVIPGASEGDVANAVAIGPIGQAVLAGSHVPVGGSSQFSALQLMPSGSTVQLDWATALSGPFGPTVFDGDQAFGVAIDCNDSVILGGFHQFLGFVNFAALQLIPQGTAVGLGWATALSGPFGPTNNQGDAARAMVIDQNNAIILAGLHSPPAVADKFAALQLIPNVAGTVELGWSTVVPTITPLSSQDRARSVAIDENNNVILGGFSDPFAFPRERFAAAELRQPFVPAYGDYVITSINEAEDFIFLELTLIDTPSSIVCPGQELCIKDFGPCCIQ